MVHHRNNDLWVFGYGSLMWRPGFSFVETSPAPVKYAVSLLGRGSEEVRLPLAEASENARVQVKKAMQIAGII